MEHSYKKTRKLADQVEKDMLEGREFKGLETAFEGLDLYFEGLDAGELILIGGRPSMGKTGFAISMIKNLCLDGDKSCLYFTLGESPKMLMERMIETVAMVDRARSKGLSEAEKKEVKKTTNNIRKSKLIIESKSVSINKIIRKCIKYSMKEKPDFIVVDYLQLIYSKKSKSDEDKYRSYVKKLRKTARLIQCPIILLTQLPRTVEEREDHRPVLNDLRGYGLIEMYADKVIFLYRDEYYDYDTERKGIVDVTVAKNKNGTIGTIPLAHLGRGLMVSIPMD